MCTVNRVPRVPCKFTRVHKLKEMVHVYRFQAFHTKNTVVIDHHSGIMTVADAVAKLSNALKLRDKKPELYENDARVAADTVRSCTTIVYKLVPAQPPKDMSPIILPLCRRGDVYKLNN